MLEYKGYTGAVEVDWEAGMIHGRVLGLHDVVTFEGSTPEEAARDFREQIDFYLEVCSRRGKDPDQPHQRKPEVRLNATQPGGLSSIPTEDQLDATAGSKSYSANQQAVGRQPTRDDLVTGNTALVSVIARRYLGRGLSLEDLIQAGNTGLLRAAEAYRADWDLDFREYASFWIKSSIRVAILRFPRTRPNSGPTSHYMGGFLIKVRRVGNHLAERLRGVPRPE